MFKKLLSLDQETTPPILKCIYSNPTTGERVYAVYWDAQRVGRVEIGWDYRALRLHLINIQPDFRNKGIGTALLKYLLELAAANGRNSLIINGTRNPILLHIARKLRPNCLCAVKTFLGHKLISQQRKKHLNTKDVYTVSLPVVPAGCADRPE